MPDGDPKYMKLPRPQMIAGFQHYVRTKPIVEHLIELMPQLYVIKRRHKNDLIVHITNLYIVSEADVHEILAEESHINCIVTVSAWNGYSLQAKEMCKEMDIGLFTFREFMGAIYYDGREFLDYVHPADREK